MICYNVRIVYIYVYRVYIYIYICILGQALRAALGGRGRGLPARGPGGNMI